MSSETKDGGTDEKGRKLVLLRVKRRRDDDPLDTLFISDERAAKKMRIKDLRETFESVALEQKAQEAEEAAEAKAKAAAAASEAKAAPAAAGAGASAASAAASAGKQQQQQQQQQAPAAPKSFRQVYRLVKSSSSGSVPEGLSRFIEETRQKRFAAHKAGARPADDRIGVSRDHHELRTQTSRADKLQKHREKPAVGSASKGAPTVASSGAGSGSGAQQQQQQQPPQFQVVDVVPRGRSGARGVGLREQDLASLSSLSADELALVTQRLEQQASARRMGFGHADSDGALPSSFGFAALPDSFGKQQNLGRGRGRGTPAGEGLMSIHQQQLKAKLDRVAERKQAKAAAELARTLALAEEVKRQQQQLAADAMKQQAASAGAGEGKSGAPKRRQPRKALEAGGSGGGAGSGPSAPGGPSMASASLGGTPGSAGGSGSGVVAMDQNEDVEYDWYVRYEEDDDREDVQGESADFASERDQQLYDGDDAVAPDYDSEDLDGEQDYPENEFVDDDEEDRDPRSQRMRAHLSDGGGLELSADESDSDQEDGGGGGRKKREGKSKGKKEGSKKSSNKPKLQAFVAGVTATASSSNSEGLSFRAENGTERDAADDDETAVGSAARSAEWDAARRRLAAEKKQDEAKRRAQAEAAKPVIARTQQGVRVGFAAGLGLVPPAGAGAGSGSAAGAGAGERKGAGKGKSESKGAAGMDLADENEDAVAQAERQAAKAKGKALRDRVKLLFGPEPRDDDESEGEEADPAAAAAREAKRSGALYHDPSEEFDRKADEEDDLDPDDPRYAEFLREYGDGDEGDEGDQEDVHGDEQDAAGDSKTSAAGSAGKGQAKGVVGMDAGEDDGDEDPETAAKLREVLGHSERLELKLQRMYRRNGGPGQPVGDPAAHRSLQQRAKRIQQTRRKPVGIR